MLKKALCFLFSVFFLTTFNGYAEEVAVESPDVEVSSNETTTEVADNVEASECSEVENCNE